VGPISYRVLRGGIWDNSAPYCRVSYRNYLGNPYHRGDGYGFRVVSL
jgi:formylglycine-generating enzyme required for sulfatase activity